VSGSDREHWDRRWASGTHSNGATPVWLDAIELPRFGRALDVAAGAGRVALWAARRGLDVLAVDVSAVALERCRAAAKAEGLRVETLALDLERAALPEGPFDLITCFHYLQRDLFPAMRARLVPGGALVCEVANRCNLERHARPSARFLLEPGELRGLVSPLEVVHFEEGWFDDWSQSRVIARAPRRV
jgi:SAM-dependent methyltransferase